MARSFDDVKNTMDSLYEGGHQYLTNLPPTEKQEADKARASIMEQRLVRCGAATVALSYVALGIRVRST